jgi:hypothetical protein
MTKIRLKSANRKSGLSRLKVRKVMAELFGISPTKKTTKKKAAPKIAPKKSYRKAA